MKRWAYRLGQALGSGMAGQRLQLDDWRRSAIAYSNGAWDVDLRELADQRRAEEEAIQQHNDRRGLLNAHHCWCGDPRCNG
jgi:hypothetical protein